MAPSRSASDMAGNIPRNIRGERMLTVSVPLLERRAENFFFRHLAPGEVGDDPSIAEDVDMVAMCKFVDLRRVPHEHPPLVRLAADQAVDLPLGADINPAHGIVHEND